LKEGRTIPEPARLWAGSGEPLFAALPGTILANFYNPHSENALLWNLIYPRAQPSLSLGSLLALKTLWGTPEPGDYKDDELIPYYWGYAQGGSRLSGLDGVLDAVDGPGPKTEIDLFLLGKQRLIAVEAKHNSVFGHCSRYAAHRCPEIHKSEGTTSTCHYWEPGPGQFEGAFAFGSRPTNEDVGVPCHRHYQLARTYLVGRNIAERLGLDFALWVFLPQKRWRAIEATWKDFTDRVIDDHAWRWMRVISWEQIQTLPTK
jgi:hypothetical protein